MIIECTSCHSKYQYDEDRFERKPSKKIRCAKCQTIFEIFNPAFASKPAAAASEAGESTFNRRHDETRTGKPKVVPTDTTESSPLPKTGTDKAHLKPQLPEGKRLSLAVIDGPDASRVYRIEKPRVTIGRANADLTLNDTETSRNHAAIEVRDTMYILHDLNSTNGTFVDGERISDATELQDKSEFQIGSSTIMFIVTDEG